MAITMVSASSGVMNSLLSKLTKLIGEEYGRLKGVRKEVVYLRDEFGSINALLEKLAGMDQLDVQAIEWRNQVREMSYDIEDCIDDFMCHLVKSGASSKGFVNKTARHLKKLRARHQIANRIHGIKARVKEASERRMRYKLDDYVPISTVVPVDPRVVAIYVEAASLVGMDAPRDELVKLLMGEEQELKVVSVVGFGGLGKTTLANEAYRKLEGKFDCCAFVSVSQKPDVPRLLSKILFKLSSQLSPQNDELDDVLNNIREYLKDKRYIAEQPDIGTDLKNKTELLEALYFIIIDDLWDSLSWNIIRCAFPENNRGCRVLTTTRIYSVALSCCFNSKSCVYNMRPLDERDSRRLFSSRIFGQGEGCHTDTVFEEFSADILKRCGGLPLAIINIASLLACQPKSTWEYVRNSMRSMFDGNPMLEGMKQILDLSYKNLPHHLKTCLLYLGLYPEDHVMKKNDLLRQWVAEGFVSTIHGLDAEDVATSYFNELINRSMIQPVERDYSGEVLSCKIHDVMLDLVRSKSAEENFISVTDFDQIAIGMQKKARRVTLHYDEENQQVMPATISGSLSQVRSIAVFRGFLWSCFPEFKYLRVLHLEYPKTMVVDLTAMCGLFQLRYIKIACDYRTSLQLPGQIGELRQLETIDVEWARRVSIPSDIVSLSRLSHLIVPQGTELPDGIGHLKSLRTLQWFDLSANSVNNAECLGELTNIRDLRLCCGTSATVVDAVRRMDALCSSLERLSRSSSLKSLVLDNLSLVSSVGLSTLSPSPRHLRKLDLYGHCFSRIPKWIAQLQDLYSLALMVREVVSNGDDVGILVRLPSLVHLNLWIRECTQGRLILSSGSASFLALKHLVLECPKLLLAFQPGVMVMLQKLELRFNVKGWEQGCGSCLPVGIHNLPHGLREIHLWRRFDCDAGKGDVAAAKSALQSAFHAHHPGADLFFGGAPWVIG